MRLLRLALVLVLAACAWPAAAISNQLEPKAAAPSARVGIFYYPWFATPKNDGRYAHWQQGGMQPPTEVASSFFPVRGVYSSADALVVDAQMAEIAGAGLGVVITSWWGRDSREDRRLPQLLGAARRHGLSVAAHIEPYRGRTVASTEVDIAYLRGLGISDVYIWASAELPDADWAEMNTRLEGVRVFANTNLAGRASRRAGARYDEMWRGAVRGRADLVTVTSYNEWHEGTQIEPARNNRSGYESYEGAWGLSGTAAESAYLDRTAYWVNRLIRG